MRRNSSRLSALRLLMLGMIALLVSCAKYQEGSASPVPLISETNELVVLLLNSPTTFYIDADGQYAGLEYALVTRFAELNQLKVQFIVVKNYHEMQRKIQAKEAHLAVGMVREPSTSALIFGPVYQQSTLSFIYPNTCTEKTALADITMGKQPVVVPSHYTPYLSRWQQQSAPFLAIRSAVHEDDEMLISAVAEGKLPGAVVDSLAVEVANDYYPNVLSYPIPHSHAKRAWALRQEDAELQEKVHRFFAAVQKDQSLRYLHDLYYGHVERLEAVDAAMFLKKRKGVLPRYKRFFWLAERDTGIDWRLLAALAYQESQWDPQATSPYGVRGMMMLTTDTAQRLGVTDRLDPLQSIMGGARYIKKLRTLFSEQTADTDRHWLALAAYNVGIGHLNDARQIARWQKKNPDAWADVKTTLPLLRQYEYFSKTKNGYARGWEPVIFVESLRTYYDILVRFEKPLGELRPELDKNITVSNPNNRLLEINSLLNPLPT